MWKEAHLGKLKMETLPMRMATVRKLDNTQYCQRVWGASCSPMWLLSSRTAGLSNMPLGPWREGSRSCRVREGLRPNKQSAVFAVFFGSQPSQIWLRCKWVEKQILLLHCRAGSLHYWRVWEKGDNVVYLKTYCSFFFFFMLFPFKIHFHSSLTWLEYFLEKLFHRKGILPESVSDLFALRCKRSFECIQKSWITIFVFKSIWSI